MLDGIEVRRALPHDAPFIEALSAKVFAEYARAPGAHARRMSEAPQNTTLLALWRGRRAGFAVVRHCGMTAHVDAIAVTVTARGRGVGARLLARAEAEARAGGCRRITLVTADANVAALSLFLRSGYTVHERLRGYYPRGQDALALSRSLNSSRA